MQQFLEDLWGGLNNPVDGGLVAFTEFKFDL